MLTAFLLSIIQSFSIDNNFSFSWHTDKHEHTNAAWIFQRLFLHQVIDVDAKAPNILIDRLNLTNRS